jgi:PAS domain S-box-containing protein
MGNRRLPSGSRLNLSILCLTTIIGIAPPTASAAGGTARVFVVQSYHAGLTWTDSVMAGIQETFARSKVDALISTDYLDARRYPDLRARTADLVVEKLRRFKPDLVIVCDNDALKFVVERRGRDIPQAPVVFCGINSFHPAMLAGQADITGVPEDVSIEESVQVARRLHPGTRRVVVVGRRRVPADLANREAFESAVPSLGAGVEVVFWDDLSARRLRSRLESLETGTIVFINGLLQDETGRELMYDQTTAFMRASSRVPLYSLWDVYLGHGIVGGKLVSGRKQAEMAAAIAVRILGGERADAIPLVSAQDANLFMFDARELERFGIARSLLPAGSVVVHESASLWRTHRWEIAGVAAFVVGEGAVIIILVLSIRLRRRTQRALKEQGERLGLALAGADLGTWDWDVATGHVTFNTRWAGMLGYRLEEIDPHVRSWETLLNPDDAAGVMETLRAHLAGETASYEVEHRLRHKAGHWVWVLSKGKVIARDTDGKPLRMCGTHLDITERKTAEEERLELERRLLHSQKLESLGVLAGGIAHDFNNLLMAIHGNLELAQLDAPPVGKTHGHLGEALRATQRATDLTRQMLAYSGKGRFVVREIDVSAFVDEITHLLQASISKTVTLDLRLARNLPSVLADSAQLQQVVMNLITNAAEAIEAGAGKISVVTGVRDCDDDYLVQSHLEEKPPAGRYVFLEVSDTGCGMDAETRRRLFDPFFSSKATGRGLGMSAVLGIVRGHKGAIMVYSEVGAGTTVKVLLPALAPAAQTQPTGDRHDTAVPATTPAPPGLALIVDDEDRVREITQQMLERLGFRVEALGDSEQAIARFRACAADVAFVLLDLTLPKLDGVVVFSELRRIRPDVKVILSSGYNRQDVMQRFAGKGPNGFVQKPYELSILEAEIRRVLGAA